MPNKWFITAFMGVDYIDTDRCDKDALNRLKTVKNLFDSESDAAEKLTKIRTILNG